MARISSLSKNKLRIIKMFVCDISKTKNRKKDLKKYYRKSVYGIYAKKRRIQCSHYLNCRGNSRNPNLSFYPFQLSGVGDFYDLKHNNKKLRVVVTGYEFGANDHLPGSKYYSTKKPNGFVSVNECSDMIREDNQRLPMMKGTALLLKQIFNVNAGNKLLVNGSNKHIFDCFSFVNMLLCSQCGINRQSSHTITMIRHCSWHYIRAMEILEPTHIFILGKSYPDFDSIVKQLNKEKGCKCQWKPIYKGTKNIDIRELLWQDTKRNVTLKCVTCTFVHPATRNQNRWVSSKSWYYKNVVRKAIACLSL
jgi:hypothetical protein